MHVASDVAGSIASLGRDAGNWHVVPGRRWLTARHRRAVPTRFDAATSDQGGQAYPRGQAYLLRRRPRHIYGTTVSAVSALEGVPPEVRMMTEYSPGVRGHLRSNANPPVFGVDLLRPPHKDQLRFRTIHRGPTTSMVEPARTDVDDHDQESWVLSWLCAAFTMPAGCTAALPSAVRDRSGSPHPIESPQSPRQGSPAGSTGVAGLSDGRAGVRISPLPSSLC